MINAEKAPAMTKGPGRPVGKPAITAPGPIDLDRVVFDPEYRARVRDALNRAARTQPSPPAQGSTRESPGGG